jgi:hypothetical protein
VEVVKEEVEAAKEEVEVVFGKKKGTSSISRKDCGVNSGGGLANFGNGNVIFEVSICDCIITRK